MPISLHAAFVPSSVQILGAVAGLIDKAEAHCAEAGVAPAELIGARLAPDMADFAYQVKSCAIHSAGAVDGVLAGNFSPDMVPPPGDFAGLKAIIAAATARLQAVGEAELEALIGKPMAFTMGPDFRLDFTAENFLLTFSQPNFYFHATTAYDILRARGLAIGKMDFLGAMRMGR
jgi:hypothetical protein